MQLPLLKEKERSEIYFTPLSFSPYFTKFYELICYYHCRVIANILYLQSRCPSVKKIIKLRQCAASICVPFEVILSFKQMQRVVFKVVFQDVFEVVFEIIIYPCVWSTLTRFTFTFSIPTCLLETSPF